MSKFPPRVWLEPDEDGNGRNFSHSISFISFPASTEYLSTEEHEHLLEAAQAEAEALRAEVERLSHAAWDTIARAPQESTITAPLREFFKNKALAPTKRGGEEQK